MSPSVIFRFDRPAMTCASCQPDTRQGSEAPWRKYRAEHYWANGPYSYINTNNAIVPMPQVTTGHWLFCASGAVAPFNLETLRTVAATTGPTPAGISLVTLATTAVRSNTVRTFAWGGAQGAAGLQNNTDIIALNNAIISMLGNGDVRKNYVLIGAVWTGGLIPPGGTTQPTPPVAPPLPPAIVLPGAQSVGSVLLSNATMETYHQAIDNPSPPDYSPAFGFNCFNCHNTGSADSAGNLSKLSHIWSTLQPLQQTTK